MTETFSEWIKKKDYLDPLDIDDILNPKNIDHNRIFVRFYRKYRRTFYISKNYLYLTLSPDKFLRNLEVSDSNKLALKRWCDNWFEYNPKYYGDYAYVIEGGSNNDHLHVHAVVSLLSSHKHAEKLKKSWARTFPKSQLLTTVNLQSKSGKRGEYAYLQFDSSKILEDKLLYFRNECKGIHSNLVDLGLRGSRGFLTDNNETPSL